MPINVPPPPWYTPPSPIPPGNPYVPPMYGVPPYGQEQGVGGYFRNVLFGFNYDNRDNEYYVGKALEDFRDWILRASVQQIQALPAWNTVPLRTGRLRDTFAVTVMGTSRRLEVKYGFTRFYAGFIASGPEGIFWTHRFHLFTPKAIAGPVIYEPRNFYTNPTTPGTTPDYAKILYPQVSHLLTEKLRELVQWYIRGQP